MNPVDGIDNRFIFYFVLNDEFISKLNPLQRGTSYPAVRDADVLSQALPLPPLPEQRRIVAEIEKQFTRLDASVAALKRVQANLKRYRASVLQSACEGKLVPTDAELAKSEGRDYEPADQLLARILSERRARWEAQEKRHGKYTYYICHSLLKRGKGTCETPRLNAKNFEKIIVDEIRANILTESNIRDLVKLLDEEMDGVARDQRHMLESIDGELEEVKNQLGRVWHFIARSDSVDVAEASDLIVELRERKEKLEVATEEARALLKERRQFLDSADTIAAFAAEMSDFLKTSELTETKAFVGSFVKEVVVKPGRAAIVYSIPTPDDSPMGGADAAEIALNGRVMNSVRHGGPKWSIARVSSWLMSTMRSPARSNSPRTYILQYKSDTAPLLPHSTRSGISGNAANVSDRPVSGQ